MTDKELECICQEARGKLMPTSHLGWVHKKSGNIYTVYDVYLLESDHTPMVAYARSSRLRWVRPLSEFLEKFERVV